MTNLKLLTNFYTELSSDFSNENNKSFNCIVQLNTEHEVYKGHFEQIPVAPGVCLVQTIKEILIEKFNTDLFLFEGNNIKFLALINPREISVFQLDFLVDQADQILDVTASYNANGMAYTKFKGKFKIV